MEYITVFANNYDVKTLKELSADVDKMEAKRNWTNEDLKKLDKLAAKNNSFTAKMEEQLKQTSGGQKLLASNLASR